MLPINLLAVVLAALASFILGFLFHGPISGKVWMRLANIVPTGNEKMSDMVPQMVWNFVVNLFTSYALAVVYVFASTSQLTDGPGVATGIICGILVWAGFIATSTSIEVIWLKRSSKLWLFETVCSLVVMIAMGAIIGGMM
ncbi:MAG: DUF1761 domain-containing protein [Patescibacteria group bacterium]